MRTTAPYHVPAPPPDWTAGTRGPAARAARQPGAAPLGAGPPATRTEPAARGAPGENGATAGSVALDLTQLGLDVAGIFDPTPICDGANGLISLARGDWTGALVSGVSMVPYVGDAAKLAKLERLGGTLDKVSDLVRASPEAAKALRVPLEKLKALLDRAPTDSLPEALRGPLQALKGKLDGAFAAVNRAEATPPATGAPKGAPPAVGGAKAADDAGRGAETAVGAGGGAARAAPTGRAAPPPADAGKAAAADIPGPKFTPRGRWQFPAAAKTAGDLEEVAKLHGGSLVRIGEHPPDQVRGVAVDGTIHQVWVNPAYGKYRKAYEEASKLPNRLKPLSNGDHVDHVLPKVRAAAMGYEYVILTSAKGPINSGWGGTEKVLKALLAHPRGPSAEPPIRGVNEMGLAKILGLSKKDPGYLGRLGPHNPSGGPGIYGDPGRAVILAQLEKWGLIR